MYLKNIFNTRKGQIAATIGSLAFGLYNLYILGRTDEIDEICDLAEDGGRTLFMRRMDGKDDFPLKVSKGKQDDCDFEIG